MTYVNQRRANQAMTQRIDTLNGENSRLRQRLRELKLPEHPHTIPGELLAEACELGMPFLGQVVSAWQAGVVFEDGVYPDRVLLTAEGSTPAEALQAVITKARESEK